MTNFKTLNRLFGGMVFIIASVVYLLTIEPTASWWDCGEYIATAFKLQVGHPPGAPLFQMIGRFFSLFAFGDVTHVAMMVNIMSALSSSLAVLFLFWAIVLLAKKIVSPAGEMTPGQLYLVFASGFIGAMTFTFTDSFWFSAVEGEVYAMSAFFTSITFWAILKWESVADEKHASRWIILIFFLMGLAIGVHLLNLLVLPAICLVFYYKKFKASRKGAILTFLVSILILAFIMYFIIPYVVELSGKFELLFVNVFGLPFNSGTIFYFILLIGLIVWGLHYTRKHGRTIVNTAILAFVFILIGYSSFVMLVIRANAETPINENAPKDAISLLSYLNREQYGDWPLLYGQYYNAPVINYKDGKPVYAKDTASGKYVIIDDRKSMIPEYDPRFTTIFPRMWSNARAKSAEFYKNWGGEGVPITINDAEGGTKTINRPTFGENLKYFFSYQVNYMYLRYFMWNFSGRQNDVQGFGGVQDGNWITGIPFIDKWRLGHPQTNLPESMQNRATNKYYMLPLILGLIGLFFQVKKDYKGSLVAIVLFIMTGLAIIVYLNQQPFEPRERDYAYVGSFYAFCIWIGLGVISLVEFLRKYLKREILSITIVTLITLLLVPGIMARENWDDHNRSEKYACRDYAANYLNSCSKDGILFTNGDNDTFPLWYDQEVEGIRTDVRVCNLMLASGSWYIDQLYRKAYDSDPVPFSFAEKQYRQGSNDAALFYDRGIQGYTELKDFVAFLKSEDPNTFVTLQNGEKLKYYPTKKLKLTVDTANCIKYGIVPSYLRNKMVDTIYWTIKSNTLYKNDIMMLDLIASTDWKRPLYFAAHNSVAHCFNVDSFCILEGWVYKFMPVKALPSDYIPGMGGVDPLGSYDLIMNKFRFGNLADEDVYVDPESLNNSLRAKTNFLRTAQGLIVMRKYNDALRLMDMYFRNYPESKFSYDMFDSPMAEMYYQCGEPAKANKIVKKIAQIYNENLDYYFSFDKSYREYFEKDIQQAFGTIRHMSMLAERYRQKPLQAEIDSIFNQKIKGY